MVDINSVFLTGRVVRDMAQKTTAAGLRIGEFALDVTKSVKRGEDWGEEAQLINCVCYGDVCDAALKAGDRATVAGTLKRNKWQDRDGNTHSELVVNVLMIHGCTAAEAKAEADKEVPF